MGYLGAVLEAAWAVLSGRKPEQAKTSKSDKHIKTCGGSLPRGRAASMRLLLRRVAFQVESPSRGRPRAPRPTHGAKSMRKMPSTGSEGTAGLGQAQRGHAVSETGASVVRTARLGLPGRATRCQKSAKASSGQGLPPLSYHHSVAVPAVLGPQPFRTSWVRSQC